MRRLRAGLAVPAAAHSAIAQVGIDNDRRLDNLAVNRLAHDDAGITFLRRKAARTIDDLWDAVAQVLPLFAKDECANYFSAAGYEPE